jgi:exodeoxyribonuclease V beta subunit
LLHSQQGPADLDLAPADGFPAEMNFEADLQRLVDNSAASIGLQPLPELPRSGESGLLPAQTLSPELARFSRNDLQHWRINSFTALTRDIHQPSTSGAISSRGDPILDFPAGSHIGLLLHSLLEHLDFEQSVASQSEMLLARFLPGSGLGAEQLPTLLEWLDCIVKTPLDGQALRLNQLSTDRRLNELEFDFAVDHLDIPALNRFMQSLSPLPLADIGNPEFGGLITGVIDLVFEYQGRFYLADYKSNFLGASLDDYAPSKLQQAMFDRRYDLQSLIYSLALHRYLGHRLAGYDYSRHFGGSYYLFMRAMRPQQANRFGIHFERPQADVVEAFDRMLGFSPAAGIAS